MQEASHPRKIGGGVVKSSSRRRSAKTVARLEWAGNQGGRKNSKKASAHIASCIRAIRRRGRDTSRNWRQCSNWTDGLQWWWRRSAWRSGSWMARWRCWHSLIISRDWSSRPGCHRWESEEVERSRYFLLFPTVSWVYLQRDYNEKNFECPEDQEGVDERRPPRFPLQTPEGPQHPQCKGGCLWSYSDSNAYVEQKTCKECGFRKKNKKEMQQAAFRPEACPHEITDKKGSSKTMARTFCLQCQTCISEMPQTEARERQHAAKKSVQGIEDTVRAAMALVGREDLKLPKKLAIECLKEIARQVHLLFEEENSEQVTWSRCSRIPSTLWHWRQMTQVYRLLHWCIGHGMAMQDTWLKLGGMIAKNGLKQNSQLPMSSAVHVRWGRRCQSHDGNTCWRYLVCLWTWWTFCYGSYRKGSKWKIQRFQKETSDFVEKKSHENKKTEALPSRVKPRLRKSADCLLNQSSEDGTSEWCSEATEKDLL